MGAVRRIGDSPNIHIFQIQGHRKRRWTLKCQRHTKQALWISARGLWEIRIWNDGPRMARTVSTILRMKMVFIFGWICTFFMPPKNCVTLKEIIDKKWERSCGSTFFYNWNISKRRAGVTHRGQCAPSLIAFKGYAWLCKAQYFRHRRSAIRPSGEAILWPGLKISLVSQFCMLASWNRRLLVLHLT